jgi:hypothetical protein
MQVINFFKFFKVSQLELILAEYNPRTELDIIDFAFLCLQYLFSYFWRNVIYRPVFMSRNPFSQFQI